MSAVIRIGLVGCGRLAEGGYVPAASRARGVEIVAVCDPDPARRTLVGEALGLAPALRHETAWKLIASDRPDAIVVASPARTHVENASVAAAAGLPCLVEKPPAADAAGARELLTLDPAPRLAFNRRFSLGRALCSSSSPPTAAPPTLIEGVLHYRRRSWNPIGDLGDAWLDLGPHLVDLALLAGAGAGSERLRVASARLEARSAEVELVRPGCRVRLSCATDRPHRERLRIEAAGGQTLLDARNGGLRGLVPVPGRPHPLVASLADQLESFALLVRGGEPAGPSPATAADGVAVMELIDAARERAAAGGAAVS